jgi:hypothetical protein
MAQPMARNREELIKMEETALRAAFERSGLLPRLLPTYDEEEVAFSDPSDLSDFAIINELNELRPDITDITLQLDDDKEDGLKRGENWRYRAKKARRHKSVRVVQLEAEARRRNLLAAFPEEAARLAQRQLERAARQREGEAKYQAEMERQRQHRAEKQAEQDAIREKREQQRDVRKADQAARKMADCELFVDTAREILPRPMFIMLWDKVREKAAVAA